jgi:hypothetical protein
MTGTYRLLVTGTRHMDAAGTRLLREQLTLRLDRAVAEEKQLVVVQGECVSGVDRDARLWVTEMRHAGWPVITEGHPAKGHPTQDFGDWPQCGPKRNKYMASLGADECLALIGPCTSIRCKRIYVHASHGASNCADRAEEFGIPTQREELWQVS